jgi:hypothetical protein
MRNWKTGRFASDGWRAHKIVGDAAASDKRGTHTVHGSHIAVEWKRGPKGQGWHWEMSGVWKGCFETSEAALKNATFHIERDQKAWEREAALVAAQ